MSPHIGYQQTCYLRECLQPHFLLPSLHSTRSVLAVTSAMTFRSSGEVTAVHSVAAWEPCQTGCMSRATPPMCPLSGTFLLTRNLLILSTRTSSRLSHTSRKGREDLCTCEPTPHRKHQRRQRLARGPSLTTKPETTLQGNLSCCRLVRLALCGTEVNMPCVCGETALQIKYLSNS